MLCINRIAYWASYDLAMGNGSREKEKAKQFDWRMFSHRGARCEVM